VSGKFKKIGIIGKFRDDTVGDTIQNLYDFLIERDHKVLLDEVTAMLLPHLDIPLATVMNSANTRIWSSSSVVMAPF